MRMPGGFIAPLILAAINILLMYAAAALALVCSMQLEELGCCDQSGACVHYHLFGWELWQALAA